MCKAILYPIYEALESPAATGPSHTIVIPHIKIRHNMCSYAFINIEMFSFDVGSENY